MKKLAFFLVASLLFAAIIVPASAGKPSDIPIAKHLYLYEKDPTDWSIVDGGAWGKLMYQNQNVGLNGQKFVFNGHGLVPNTKYSLIYYPDPWAGSTDYLDTTAIGAGRANSKGDIHISGRYAFDQIPTQDDLNYGIGAKIWLVTASDHNGERMIAWNPTDYLFENNFI
jgi:hypothetical protein